MKEISSWYYFTCKYTQIVILRLTWACTVASWVSCSMRTEWVQQGTERIK